MQHAYSMAYRKIPSHSFYSIDEEKRKKNKQPNCGNFVFVFIEQSISLVADSFEYKQIDYYGFESFCDVLCSHIWRPFAALWNTRLRLLTREKGFFNLFDYFAFFLLFLLCQRHIRYWMNSWSHCLAPQPIIVHELAWFWTYFKFLPDHDIKRPIDVHSNHCNSFTYFSRRLIWL